MENASKALVMAGSVLLGLLVLGALVLLFNNLSSYKNSEIQNTRQAQVVEFNNQFTTYIRDDVRGNELYSLLNRIIDYNKRKTLEGEDGAIDIGYQPMSIKFSLKSPDGKDQKALTMDGVVRFFEKNKNDYIIDKTNNTFEDYINNQIKKIVNGNTGKQDDLSESVLNTLITGITKIFLEKNASDVAKEKTVNAFKNITGFTNVKVSDLEEGSNYRERVYSYYEYVQFKRANFNCINSIYDPDTGRIIYLEFQFNGKIQ